MSEYIEKVEPVKVTKASGEIYLNVVNAVLKEPVGWYKVNIPDRKPATVYQQLYKKMKDRKDLKLHKIKDTVYLEKLSVKK